MLAMIAVVPPVINKIRDTGIKTTNMVFNRSLIGKSPWQLHFGWLSVPFSPLHNEKWLPLWKVHNLLWAVGSYLPWNGPIQSKRTAGLKQTRQWLEKALCVFCVLIGWKFICLCSSVVIGWRSFSLCCDWMKVRLSECSCVMIGRSERFNNLWRF